MEIQTSIFNEENPKYLSEQIITYIGNKRALLSFIGTAVNLVKEELGTDELDIMDIFSGSGIVSRYLKKDAKTLYVNDLEKYCETINECYLTNQSDLNIQELKNIYDELVSHISEEMKPGFISELYAPADDENIQPGERVFYTTRNANYIDTARQLIETVPEEYKNYVLAPLLYESSVHTNTSGVFKGFYKNSKTGIGQYGGDGRNALKRILSDINLPFPVFSNYDCDTVITRKDANELVREMDPVDIVYMDPPYNQHPYGSNYFMLNLINDYKRPENISKVSGIPAEWNKSKYNKKQLSYDTMRDLCEHVNAKYLLISFSDDGFISQEQMVNMLEKIGDVRVFDKTYNTFRGCRNLESRKIHVKELLYLVRRK